MVGNNESDPGAAAGIAVPEEDVVYAQSFKSMPTTVSPAYSTDYWCVRELKTWEFLHRTRCLCLLQCVACVRHHLCAPCGTGRRVGCKYPVDDFATI